MQSRFTLFLHVWSTRNHFRKRVTNAGHKIFGHAQYMDEVMFVKKLCRVCCIDYGLWASFATTTGTV